MVKGSRGKLGRADWLAAALSALEEGGLGAVKVLPLATKLKASRGSFYWHFRDRDDLLRSVLDYWDTEITDAVIERSMMGVGEPRERLRKLANEVIGERRGRYDPAIRAWAHHDREAAAVVQRVDRKRLAYLKSLFLGLGFDAEEAEARSRLTLAYFIGDHVILVKEPSRKRRRLMLLRFEALIAGSN
jgi:AcrR family transcriptional regulator